MGKVNYAGVYHYVYIQAEVQKIAFDTRRSFESLRNHFRFVNRPPLPRASLAPFASLLKFLFRVPMGVVTSPFWATHWTYAEVAFGEEFDPRTLEGFFPAFFPFDAIELTSFFSRIIKGAKCRWCFSNNSLFHRFGLTWLPAYCCSFRPLFTLWMWLSVLGKTMCQKSTISCLKTISVSG